MMEITVAPAPYVTIPVASQVTGYTEKAINRKIEDGVWVEGRAEKTFTGIFVPYPLPIETLLERELIQVYINQIRDRSGRYNGWLAMKYSPKAEHGAYQGATPRIAAYRAYVASVFGDEVQEPQ